MTAWFEPGTAAGTPRSLAPCPPKGFRPAREVSSAWPCGVGPFGDTSHPSSSVKGAKAAGLRYERKALDFLSERFEGLRKSPWFRFKEPHDARRRWCQPDALLLRGDTAIIFEVKTRLCEEAWWQLRMLYEPVVRRAFYARTIGLCVVTANFDPRVAAGFPEPLELLDEIESFVQRRSFERMAAFQWRH